MQPICDLLYGSLLSQNELPSSSEALITAPGKFNGKFASVGVTEKHLSKNTLFVGGTGSGKTNALNLLLSEIRKNMTEHDVMIIFDTKGDFERCFFDAGKDDVIIGNSSQYRSRSQIWNVFKDVLVDGWKDELVSININEIARGLFEKNKSESQPFFANAARGIFCAQMLATIRSASSDKEIRATKLNNKALLDYFNQATIQQFDILSQSYPDLRRIRQYLGDGTSTQALGVLAEIQVMLQDTFLGVFGDRGEFSVRDFVRQKGGRTLFLEYDLSIGETLSPLYSLLMDLALKEALGRSENERKLGSVYIVLDELKLLPTIMHLDDAVNFGRSMGARVLAGLQSVSQIYDLYGEQKGKAIITGFSSLFAFRPNDSVTREFVQEHFGKNFINEVFLVNQAPVSERRQGSVVEDWDLNSLKVGEAVVGLDGNPPFRFYFDEFIK